MLNRNGEDVTEEFITGAEETLKIATLFHIKEFIGKSKAHHAAAGKYTMAHFPKN